MSDLRPTSPPPSLRPLPWIKSRSFRCQKWLSSFTGRQGAMRSGFLSSQFAVGPCSNIKKEVKEHLVLWGAVRWLHLMWLLGTAWQPPPEHSCNFWWAQKGFGNGEDVGWGSVVWNWIWGLESEANTPSQQILAGLGTVQRGKKNGTLDPDCSGFESRLLHHTSHFLSLSLSFLSYKIEVTTPSSTGCNEASQQCLWITWCTVSSQ